MFHPERLTGRRARKYAHSVAYAPPADKVPATVMARLKCPREHVKAAVRVKDTGGLIATDTAYHWVVVVRQRIVALDHPDPVAEDTLNVFMGGGNKNKPVCRCRTTVALYGRLPRGARTTPTMDETITRLNNRAVRTPRRDRALANAARHRAAYDKSSDGSGKIVYGDLPEQLHAVRAFTKSGYCGYERFKRDGTYYWDRNRSAVVHPVVGAPWPAAGAHETRFWQFGLTDRLRQRMANVVWATVGERDWVVTVSKPYLGGYSGDGCGFHVSVTNPPPSAGDATGMVKEIKIFADAFSWWARLGRYGIVNAAGATDRRPYLLLFSVGTPNPPGGPPRPVFAAAALDLREARTRMLHKAAGGVADYGKECVRTGVVERTPAGWVFHVVDAPFEDRVVKLALQLGVRVP